jgi:hypothetical protein
MKEGRKFFEGKFGTQKYDQAFICFTEAIVYEPRK